MKKVLLLIGVLALVACSNEADSNSEDLQAENEALKKEIAELDSQETEDNQLNESQDYTNKEIQATTSKEEIMSYLEESQEDGFSFEYNEETSTLTMILSDKIETELVEENEEELTFEDQYYMLVSRGRMISSELIYEFGEEFITEWVSESNPEQPFMVYVGREIVQDNAEEYLNNIGVEGSLEQNKYTKENLEEYLENDLGYSDEDFSYDASSSTISIELYELEEEMIEEYNEDEKITREYVSKFYMDQAKLISKQIADDIGEEFTVEMYYENHPDLLVAVYKGTELIEENTEEFLDVVGIE